MLTSGGSFTVSGGKFTANVPARFAIAIHTAAQGTASATITVNFSESATTTFGEVRTAIYLRKK